VELLDQYALNEGNLDGIIISRLREVWSNKYQIVDLHPLNLDEAREYLIRETNSMEVSINFDQLLSFFIG
jgi:hypothetical protein